MYCEKDSLNNENNSDNAEGYRNTENRRNFDKKKYSLGNMQHKSYHKKNNANHWSGKQYTASDKENERNLEPHHRKWNKAYEKRNKDFSDKDSRSFTTKKYYSRKQYNYYSQNPFPTEYNNHESKSYAINGNQYPFAFIIESKDNEMSIMNDALVSQTRNILRTNTDIDKYLQEVYSNSHELLVNHAHNVQDRIGDVKRRATEEWLKTRTEKEKIQYLSRHAPSAY